MPFKKIFSIVVLNLALLASAQSTTVVTRDIDDWLDPSLKAKKEQVVKVLEASETSRNPQQFETQDYGFTSKPSSWFDWQFLAIVQKERMSLKVRPRVLDLGCGLGHMAIAILFAGGHVDAVDLNETVTKANVNIFKATKQILAYDKDTSKNFYRAFPCNIKNPTQNIWQQQKHRLALCKDLLHFFTETELFALAAQLFGNIEDGGALYILVDTPTHNALAYQFYQQRQGKVACPGLAVYNKKKGGKGLVLSGNPIAFDERIHKIRPGQGYEGRFLDNGSVQADPEVFHTVRNVFMIEDLAEIFKKAGFDLGVSFYLASDGRMLTGGKLPEIGTISKACVALTKPGPIEIPAELSEEDIAMLSQVMGLRVAYPESNESK